MINILRKYDSKTLTICSQNVVDILVAIAMAIAGIFCVADVATPASIEATYLTIGAFTWALALTFSNLIALFGVIFRVLYESGEKNPNYWIEFVGWGVSALCVFLFTVANWAEGSAAGNAALIALTVLLAGKFLHRTIFAINSDLSSSTE